MSTIVLFARLLGIEMSSYWDGFWTGMAVAFVGSQLYFLYYDIINGKIKRR